MRFLKMFFGMVFAALLGVGIFYVVYVEVSVNMEAQMVKNDLIRLRKMTLSNTGKNKCKSGNYVKDYQLRFENETEYVLEVRCGVRLTPEAIDRKELGKGVVKLAGSGFNFGPEGEASKKSTQVVLKGGYRSLVVEREEEKIGVKRGVPKEWIESGGEAKTTCQGWGHQCCSPPQKVGSGKKQNLVTDCSEDCFDVCLERPLVHFFNTSPVMNFSTQVVELESGQQRVTFSYEVDDLDGEVEAVELDFGDGERYRGGVSELVEHSYECETEVCEYRARLVVKDDSGLMQAKSPKNELKIIVKN